MVFVYFFFGKNFFLVVISILMSFMVLWWLFWIFMNFGCYGIDTRLSFLLLLPWCELWLISFSCFFSCIRLEVFFAELEDEGMEYIGYCFKMLFLGSNEWRNKAYSDYVTIDRNCFDDKSYTVMKLSAFILRTPLLCSLLDWTGTTFQNEWWSN